MPSFRPIEPPQRPRRPPILKELKPGAHHGGGGDLEGVYFYFYSTLLYSTLLLFYSVLLYSTATGQVN